MPTLMPQDTAATLGPNACNCDSRSLLLDRFVFDNPDMNEARKLHFAQVCSDSFATIQKTRAEWQATVESDKAKPAEKQKAQALLNDTNGMGQRSKVVEAALVERDGKRVSPIAQAHCSFVETIAADRLLYAQLQSRLMVNMAGGVMENAGLCLDRFGLPCIPGSAVKGCARRAALAALHEWCETSQKPGATEQDKDNLFKEACVSFDKPADMLAAIARVFGWCEADWKTRDEVLKGVRKKNDETDEEFRDRCEKLWREKRSDFAWACGDALSEPIRAEALKLLGSAPASAAADGAPAVRSDDASEGRREGASANGRGARAPRITDFAGSVSFLPAYPVDVGNADRGVRVPGLSIEDVPPLGKLELDVVTVHHQHYYAEPPEPKGVPKTHDKWQRWKRDHDAWEREWGTAPDIEEPVPNVFPAVAPGHVFAFAVVKLRHCSEGDLKQARKWLKAGLSTFGLGGKTNAGYGWFDATDSVNQAVKERLKAEKERMGKEAAQKKAAEKQAAEAKAKAQAKTALEAILQGLSPDERENKKIKMLTGQQFEARVRAFCREPRKGGPSEEEKKAIVRALRGPRIAYWQSFKTKATKGDLATVDQAIRQLSKQMLPGKKGKMP